MNPEKIVDISMLGPLFTLVPSRIMRKNVCRLRQTCGQPAIGASSGDASKCFMFMYFAIPETMERGQAKAMVKGQTIKTADFNMKSAVFQRVEKVFSPRCAQFFELEKVQKTV